MSEIKEASAVSQTVGTPGWKHFIKSYLDNRTETLTRNLTTCPYDDIREIRGALKELNEFNLYIEERLSEYKKLREKE